MKTKENNWISTYILTGMLLVLIHSCTKDDNSNKVPELSTASVPYITQTTATCGGNITTDGGIPVIARGICWSTNQMPTINDSKTTDSTGIGSFTSIMTDLTAETMYYARAYATNNLGTAYGNQVNYTTTGTVSDIEGNIYNTVSIIGQVWMAENLKTTKYVNGDPIPNVTDSLLWISLATGAYCNYNNDTSYVNTYGRLYNWYAVNENRRLAPAGWHLPTSSELITLISNLGGAEFAGGKIKEVGLTHWADPNDGATNESGYTALPGGFRNPDAGFFDIGFSSIWWSASENDAWLAWYYAVWYGGSGLGLADYFSKTGGLSVRCLKD
jgi:uncharacterized protein (TIGR02145 family)